MWVEIDGWVRRRRGWMALAVFGIVLTGCGGDDPGTGSGVSSSNTVGQGDAARVKLDVVRGRLGTVRPLVSVRIAGEGPFTFVVDTGSEKTTVDAGLVRRLGLERLEATAQVGGVAGGSRRGGVVRLERWSIGEVALESVKALAIDLPDGSAAGTVDGLLGSDVLSRFDTVELNYERETLQLGSSGR